MDFYKSYETAKVRVQNITKEKPNRTKPARKPNLALKFVYQLLVLIAATPKDPVSIQIISI